MAKISNIDQRKSWIDIQVKLTPRSSKDEILGKVGEIYGIKVTSPPVDEKANKALIELLSKRLKVPKRDIQILSGKRSRIKFLRIYGLSLKAVTDRLEK